MVKKRQSKRQRDIKTKLMAAICMLLVSSIMMVSTTYAWFTLSTAPEVTGITTAVGANGNLEMALLPTNGELDDITTGSSDSLKADTDRNVTWGNLVDVSDPSYGLNKISLYPAELNLAVEGKLSLTSLLKTPEYGADGRVSTLNPNTSTGTYSTAGAGSFQPNTEYGVRAVGTASGMTERQLSYRNARGDANTAISQATKNASDSLTLRGGALANIAVKKGTSATPAFSQEDVNTLKAIVSDLETGVLPQIETAYMKYILAFAASGATDKGTVGAGDVVWSSVSALVEDENATLESVMTGLTTMKDGNGEAITIELPAQLTTAINAYNDTKDAVDEAKELLNNLTTAETYTWEQLRPILTTLANPDAMMVNGIPAGKIMDGDNMNTLFNSVAGGKGLIVSMATGGGVYADIADQCGDYSARVEIQEIKWGQLAVGPVSATMNTQSTVLPSHLSLVGTAVETAGSPESGENNDVPITDMFGYVIDMAFRTNAADSNLLLQQDAKDRIYSSNQNGVEQTVGTGENAVTESTMGGGAYMQFVPTTNSFSNEKVVELMKAVRIVFFDPKTGDIIAYAKLDTTNTENTTDGGVKAKIVLYTVTTEETVTYVTAEEGYTGEKFNAVTSDETEYVLIEEGENYTGTKYSPKADAEGEYEEDENGTYKAVVTTVTNYVAATDGTLKKVVVAAGSEVIKTDNVIMALNQNEATRLSVLVYLDGNKVTNAEVAATAGNSVTGSMNLQFASSANLIPMNYTPLMEQGGTAETTTPPTTEGE